MQYIIKKADWKLFTSRTVMQDDNEQNCDAKFNKLRETILNAVDRCIPKTSGGESKIRVPWWTDECARVTTVRRRALRRLQRTWSDVDRASYRRWRAIARFVKNQSRTEFSRKCVSGLNSNTPMSKGWCRIRKMTGRYSRQHPPRISHNNDPTSDPYIVAELFSQHFEYVSSSHNYSPEFLRMRPTLVVPAWLRANRHTMKYITTHNITNPLHHTVTGTVLTWQREWLVF